MVNFLKYRLCCCSGRQEPWSYNLGLRMVSGRRLLRNSVQRQNSTQGFPMSSLVKRHLLGQNMAMFARQQMGSCCYHQNKFRCNRCRFRGSGCARKARIISLFRSVCMTWEHRRKLAIGSETGEMSIYTNGEEITDWRLSTTKSVQTSFLSSPFLIFGHQVASYRSSSQTSMAIGS